MCDNLPLFGPVKNELAAWPEEYWRSWRASNGPEGPQVAASWVEGNSLLHGYILVPNNGIGMRILGTPEIIAGELDWNADRFLRTEDGKITGLWELGEADVD